MKSDGRCIVHLKSERYLLSPDFEGYRLASAGAGAQPTRHSFPRNPRSKTRAPSHHSSLLHARLYGLHNALFYDQFASLSSAYYICNEGHIWKIMVQDSETTFTRVLNTPLQIPSSEDEYPPTITFCNSEKVIVSDGHDTLILFSTGNRDSKDNPKWTIESQLRMSLPKNGFTLLDARLDESARIHCIIYQIQPDENLCVAMLDWIVLELVENDWKITPHRKLKGRGVIHYCVLELGCESIYVAADKPVEFLDVPETKMSSEETEEKKILYSWMQNAEDITVTLQLEKDHRTSSLIIETLRDSIDIHYGNNCNVKGKLHGLIDHELTTWSVDDSNKLNVLLLKREPGTIWPSLLKDGDENGEQIMDPSYVAEVHARLAHLCSETEVMPGNDTPLFNSQQLEECDFVSEEESSLLRLEAESYRTTHQAFLSAHQMILNVHLDSLEVLALGLREDADTCIWQPFKSDGKLWPVKHEGTLLAFGYVQSSKQQKKYTVCSPDLKYSVVCEATRHAFIYRQEWSPQRKSQLRHRNTSGESKKVNIGKQQIISFERDEEVLGICATNDILYILTEYSLITLNMTE